MALSIWLWLVAGLYGLSAFLTLRAHARVPALPAFSPDSAAAHPRVAVVVAARNEEIRIAATVRALAQQRSVDARVVVMDDRSSDDTGSRARAAIPKEAADRLRVMRVETLPHGWLGKCNALFTGVAEATRDFDAQWILCMDADCALAPDAIARAVAAAQSAVAAHVCILPRLESHSVLGKAGLLALMIPLMRRCAAANTDRPGASMGVGAFNLIRRDIYDSFNGHASLRLEVLDDVRLGTLVGRQGGRTRIFFAPDAATVSYAGSIPEIFRVLRKNAFAALRYNLPVSIALLTTITALWLSGAFGFLAMSAAGFAASGAFLATIIPALVGARRLGWGALPAILTPFAVIVMPLAFGASIVITIRDGGVRWRDTFYSIQALREGMVR